MLLATFMARSQLPPCTAVGPMSRSANGGFGGGEAPVIGDRPLLADSGRITDVQAAPRRRAFLVEEGSIRWSISCSHARSGDSDNRPTRLIRRAISRRRPAMNFFEHLIARGMLG